MRELFAEHGLPTEKLEADVFWLRDYLGKPSIRWQDEIAVWAQRQGWDDRFLHVSNTHDGDAHLVFAAYGSPLAGIGVDVVHLARLRRPGKDRAYLQRFARQFMSETEYSGLEAASLQEEDEEFRVRVAAHFSLMEAASKACGTGLKIGVGMGRPESLPKQSIRIVQLAPKVGLQWEKEASDRLERLGAVSWEGHWFVQEDYLVSVVLLYRQGHDAKINRVEFS